ncbi:hypothetical protein GMDG_06795, partial [Pseudogymnoascus destructans 20631-21]
MTLSMNGLGVQTKSLADTGANGYLVINKPFAIRLSKALQSPIRKLPYSSKDAEYITAPLYSWTSEHPPTPSWSKEITLPYHSRETSIRHLTYQSDANRRDSAIHSEDRRRAGRCSMEMKVIISDYEEITDTPLNPLRNQEVSPPPQKTLVHRFTPMHICEISANAFHHEMMRSDSEFFQTSIYESNQIIHQKELVEDEGTLCLIQQKLPHMHRKYTDVFSKLESDGIPPHRIYDHKIQLEAPLPNSFSLLYQQATEELNVTAI